MNHPAAAAPAAEPAVAEGPRQRRAGTAAVLVRETFITSRAADFASEKELTAQTGHDKKKWPFVILRELVDNALDASEEAGTPPVIRVEVGAGGIAVSDNGPGLPKKIIGDLADFNVRVSSREAYVSPDRGRQGNALMTVLAMPFVVDGEAGRVEIATGGTAYTVEMRLDRVRQVPVVGITEGPSHVQNGTSVRVLWPDSASLQEDDAEARFVQMATAYGWLNPHLSLRLDWFGKRVLDLAAADGDWLKWRPRDPTSPHWYRPADLGRLIGAYIDRDGRAGRRRTVREFIAEFRGLARSARQKAVTAVAGLSGAHLEDLAVGGDMDMEQIGKLLLAMRAHSKAVKPRRLGIIGQDHLRRCFVNAGAVAATFQYRKTESISDGIPWIVEAAFAAHETAFEDSEDEAGRRLVCGVNWSPALVIPFHDLGDSGLESLLVEQRAGDNWPVMLAVHLACARVEYLDRGKSSVALPSEIGEAIAGAVTKVTAAWAKQRKREEREASAASRRRDRLVRADSGMTQVEAAFQVMEAAYSRASDGGTLPAGTRQIMYQARGAMQELVGKTLGKGFDAYFTQTLLPRFMDENPDLTADWDVVYDARGHLAEPHTGRTVPLGTLDVRAYLAETAQAAPHSPGQEIVNVHRYPTCGPVNRYQAVLFVEKEGFWPLFEAVKLAARYDVALMSTKGMSNDAARTIVQQLCRGDGIPLFVLHDFDKSGFSITATLRKNPRRLHFGPGDLHLIDLGLTLEDVRAWGLEGEEVCYGKSDPRPNLRKNGATKADIAFLCRGYDYHRGGHWGQRVEINALTSDQLVKLIEGKLAKHGIRKKLIPQADTLEAAYRRAVEGDYINARAAEIAEAAHQHAAAARVPRDLARRVRKLLKANPAMPWDWAVGEIVTGGDQ